MSAVGFLAYEPDNPTAEANIVDVDGVLSKADVARAVNSVFGDGRCLLPESEVSATGEAGGEKTLYSYPVKATRAFCGDMVALRGELASDVGCANIQLAVDFDPANLSGHAGRPASH